MRRERIIWSNYEISIDTPDFINFIKDCYPEYINDDNKKWDVAYEENDLQLECERMNLDIDTNPIYCYGLFGTWRGPKAGHKVTQPTNIAECLYDNDHDYCEWYCDGYDLRFRGTHHDGSSSYTYRELRDGLTPAQIKRFEGKLFSGKASHNTIKYYTKSLMPRIAEVYGWYDYIQRGGKNAKKL